MTNQTEKKYQIRNWPEYNKALVNRGSITIWFTEEAIEKWIEPCCGKRGRPKFYSDEAILCALMIKAVYRLPFRALRGLLPCLERTSLIPCKPSWYYPSSSLLHQNL